MPSAITTRFPLRCALAVAIAFGSTACAARSIGEGDGSPDDARADRNAIGDGGDVGVDIPYRDVPISYDVFREDRCPGDAGGAERAYSCDPWMPAVGCGDGQGCYPWIEYPSEPCGHEIYHADCFPTGPMPVDGFCTSTTDCAAGLTCFVTGSGNRCLLLCRNDGTAPQCPKGRVCEPTDLPDFGACD